MSNSHFWAGDSGGYGACATRLVLWGTGVTACSDGEAMPSPDGDELLLGRESVTPAAGGAGWAAGTEGLSRPIKLWVGASVANAVALSQVLVLGLALATRNLRIVIGRGERSGRKKAKSLRWMSSVWLSLWRSGQTGVRKWQNWSQASLRVAPPSLCIYQSEEIQERTARISLAAVV